MFDPIASTDPITFEFSPFTTALMAITVLTPITIPRIVRNERRGFRRSASNASPTASFSSPNPRLSCTRYLPLLRPQCHHRIEPRRLRRRIDAKEQPHAGGDDESHHHRPHLNRSG